MNLDNKRLRLGLNHKPNASVFDDLEMRLGRQPSFSRIAHVAFNGIKAALIYLQDKILPNISNTKLLLLEND